MKEKKLKRRRFLKLSGLVAGGIALFGIFKLIKDDIFGQKDSPSKDLSQSISRGESNIDEKKSNVFLSAAQKDLDMEEAVIKAVEAATNFNWLKMGQTVFIKPVLNSGLSYPATTNPIAIAAMIKLLKQKGAGKVIVGDMSGVEHLRFFKDKTTGSTRDLMKKSGMMQAIEEAGGDTCFFEEGGWDSFYKDHTDTKGFWDNGLMMPAILKNVDHIVLMPRCSSHVLSGASLGLKAVVGYWRTDTRLQYHYYADSFHERTAEGNRAKTLIDKQRLVISTGDKLLATFGPDKGYIHTPSASLVIASESIVAHDMVSLAWLLYNRKLLPAGEQDTFKDTSKTIAKLINTLVVKWLGTWGKVLTSETLLKNDLKSIWDDRVLNHAYKIFGGIPDIHLENVQNTVPEKIMKNLRKMIQYA
ncbi:DUF362 domain-containing protein [Thermodesulfobacteriota bacterium]